MKLSPGELVYILFHAFPEDLKTEYISKITKISIGGVGS